MRDVNEPTVITFGFVYLNALLHLNKRVERQGRPLTGFCLKMFIVIRM